MDYWAFYVADKQRNEGGYSLVLSSIYGVVNVTLA